MLSVAEPLCVWPEYQYVQRKRQTEIWRVRERARERMCLFGQVGRSFARGLGASTLSNASSNKQIKIIIIIIIDVVQVPHGSGIGPGPRGYKC